MKPTALQTNLPRQSYVHPHPTYGEVTLFPGTPLANAARPAAFSHGMPPAAGRNYRSGEDTRDRCVPGRTRRPGLRLTRRVRAPSRTSPSRKEPRPEDALAGPPGTAPSYAGGHRKANRTLGVAGEPGTQLVGCFVLRDDVPGNAASLADLVAALPCPFPDL